MNQGKGHRLIINAEQREWLCQWFPTIENKRLAKAMGISQSKLTASPMNWDSPRARLAGGLSSGGR